MKQQDHAAFAGLLLLGAINVLDMYGYKFASSLSAMPAYFAGVSFTDCDTLLFRYGGHRSSSPLHNILIGVLSAALALCIRNLHPSTSSDLASMFALGVLAHQLGDFIQGGVNIGARKLVGFTRFDWKTYGSPAGRMFSNALCLTAGLALGASLAGSGLEPGKAVLCIACALGMVSTRWSAGLVGEIALFFMCMFFPLQRL